MKSPISSEFFVQNRKNLQARLNADIPIVLTANGWLQKSTDISFTFKQDGSFWYFTGVDEPNVLLVIDGNTSFLVVPELSAVREAFDGAIDPAQLQAESGIDEILGAQAGWKKLTTIVKRSKRVATMMPADAFIESMGMYTNPARAHLQNQLKDIAPGLEFVDLRQIVGQMRMVKQPQELNAMQQAIDLTIAGIEEVQAGFDKKLYENEFDIELALTRAFHKDGGMGHSFEPIIAGGAKASTIHPFGNTAKIDYNKSMLLDVGAEYAHYAADISRAWGPGDDSRYQAVYTAVKSVADYAMSILKPGVVMREYEQAVEVEMGKVLQHLGLIKKVSHESIRHYFPHATSHFLGIDTHDSGDYESPLSEGVVLTVEPGIYIPDEGIGIRIEDDVLITKNGCRNLSAKLKR